MYRRMVADKIYIVQTFTLTQRVARARLRHDLDPKARVIVPTPIDPLPHLLNDGSTPKQVKAPLVRKLLEKVNRPSP